MHFEHHAHVGLIDLHLILYHQFIQLPASLQFPPQSERVDQSCVNWQIRSYPSLYHLLQNFVRHLGVFASHVSLHQ